MNSKKYGVLKISYTHSSSAVIYGSKTENDDAIRYHSLHDNKYISYFKGHRDRVISLAMNPQNDTFCSSSVDETCKLWDLKSPTLIASLPMKGKPQVSIDPSGKVLGVTSTNAIRLYDIRMTDKGPFIGTQVEPPIGGLTSIKFGPRGKTILTTSQDSTIVYDSMKLTKIKEFTDSINEAGLFLESSYTPDEEYILCGSEDGKIYIYELETGKKIQCLEGHAGPVGSVRFNPRFVMIGSACSALCMWINSIKK